MPRISMFYGILIMMYPREQGIPHFHAYYGDDAIVISIEDLGTLAGSFPHRALNLVIEWATIHKIELLNN